MTEHPLPERDMTEHPLPERPPPERHLPERHLPERHPPQHPPRSRLTGPIKDLPFLGRALLFAELSRVAYLPAGGAREAMEVMGLASAAYLDERGAQAYVLVNETDIVLTVRGTEASEWNDIRADINAVADLAETVGRVHRGFKREADQLWPLILRSVDLVNPLGAKDIWFTGHSLGGAVATICALRFAANERPGPVELHTFGSPRIGNHAYVSSVRLAHHRWVHNNDIVTRVPPRWMGYTHGTRFQYLDGRGRWNPSLNTGEIARDRTRAFWRGLRRRQVDSFADHLIATYVLGVGAALDAHGPVEPASRTTAAVRPRLPARVTRADPRRFFDRARPPRG